MNALSSGDEREMAIASPIARGVHLRSRIFMGGVIQTAFAKCEGGSFRADHRTSGARAQLVWRRVYGLMQMTPRGQGRTFQRKNSQTSQEDVLWSFCAACAG